MEYGFWYDVAEYMNSVNRGKFTPREIAGNAYEYSIEWEITLHNGELSYGIQVLVEELVEQCDDKAKEFLGEIMCEIETENIQITDKWLEHERKCGYEI